MENDLKFEDKIQTISDILKINGLPMVVKIYEEKEHDRTFDICRARISGGTEVLLHKKLKVKFGHIRVLKYYDNDMIQKEKGPENVLEHDTYVDEKFLIPLKYYGKIKFVHRPGSWRRFASISQVLSELPRYITVCEDTVALPSNGFGKNLIVPAKTKLEVMRKFKQPNNSLVYLECSDGNVSYSFCERDRINCTEVDDTKLYHLFELVRCKMLPKVIHFQSFDAKDVILMDNELNSAMQTSMEGPIELLGFEDINVIIGWVRDKESKTYMTVVIPEELWDVLMVQERSLHGTEERENYIENKYRHCGETGFIEKCLYWMSPDKRQVTWLRSPDFYERTLNGKHMFEAKSTYFQDSSDDEVSCDYEEVYEPPPPVPERHRIIYKDIQEYEKRGQEKKSLFHKVHKELLSMFKLVHPKQEHHEKKASGQTERPHRLLSAGSENVTTHHRDVDRTRTKRNPSGPRTNEHAVSDNNPSPTLSSDSEIYQYGPSSEPEESGYDYDYPDSDLITDMCRAAVVKNRPLPALPDSSAVSSGRLQATPTTSPQITSPTTSKCVGQKNISLTMEQTERLFRDNLTQDDFIKYTVMETAHVFKHCGLEHFSEKCFENRLDGSFFNNLDLNELQNEPFKLTSFHMLKVKKMIYDGWRPKVCS